MESKNKCIKKTIECKQLYKDYKNICGKDLWNETNKCSIKDFSIMDQKELESYVDYLIEKNNKYKTCYELRIKHTKDCVNKKCWDRGHSKVVIQAREIYGDCKGILLKILTFLNEQKRKAKHYLVNEYQKMSKLYAISESDFSKKLKDLNENLLKVNKRRDEIVNERRKIPANSYEKNHKIINKLKNEARKVNDEAQRLGKERKELVKLIDDEKLKNENIEENENENIKNVDRIKNKLDQINKLQDKITEVYLVYNILDSDIFQYIEESKSQKNDFIKAIDNELYKLRNIKDFDEYIYLDYLFDNLKNKQLKEKINKYILNNYFNDKKENYYSSFSSLLNKYKNDFTLNQISIIFNSIQKRSDIIPLAKTY